MDGPTLLALIIIVYIFLMFGVYKSCLTKNSATQQRLVSVGGFVLTLVLNSTTFIPEFSFSNAWGYLQILNLIVTFGLIIYLFRARRKLVVYILPQALLMLFGVLFFFVISHGINIGIL